MNSNKNCKKENFFINQKGCNTKYFDGLICTCRHECWYKLVINRKKYCNKNWHGENEIKLNYT